jgi:BASS family bile acid:Na+ symporter
MGMRKLLENTSLLFSIAIIFGLAFPVLADPISPAITPLLIVAMCLSMRQITFSRRDLSSNYQSSVAAFLLNYGLITGIVILLAFYLIPNPDYFAGFVLTVAVPPAVAVVAYTYLLGGDMKTSLGGEILGYSLAIVLTPLITLAFLGSSIDVFAIMQMLGLLIILPLIVSRALIRLPESRFTYSKSVINMCFFFVNYILIGLNQAALFTEFLSLLPLIFIVIVRTFGTGFLTYFLAKRIGVRKERAISYGLFSSYKNGGMAAAFAIVLVGTAASLPAAIGSIIGIFLIISFIEVTKRF